MCRFDNGLKGTVVVIVFRLGAYADCTERWRRLRRRLPERHQQRVACCGGEIAGELRVEVQHPVECVFDFRLITRMEI